MCGAIFSRKEKNMIKIWIALNAIIWILIFSIHEPYEGVENNNYKKPIKNIEELLSSLHGVESSYRLSPPPGDNGKSIGPYQIQWAYWKDSNVPGEYGDVRNKEYAEKVVLAYWKRYAPIALDNLDFEKLARCHNSGPRWRDKYSKTDSYWNKVRVQLDKKTKKMAEG